MNFPRFLTHEPRESPEADPTENPATRNRTGGGGGRIRVLFQGGFDQLDQPGFAEIIRPIRPVGGHGFRRIGSQFGKPLFGGLATERLGLRGAAQEHPRDCEQKENLIQPLHERKRRESKLIAFVSPYSVRISLADLPWGIIGSTCSE